MEKKKNEDSLNEQVKKIMYRVNYQLNETPKYKPVIEDDSEFDELPTEIYATQDGFPVPNVGGSDAYLEEEDDNVDELPGAQELGPKVPAEPSNTRTPDTEDVPPAPEGGEEEMPPAEEPEPEMSPEADTEFSPEEETIPEEPEKEVDEIQNDIIKHNISALEKIHAKMEQLDQMTNQVSTQLDKLNAKVKEVEEPTNVEKMVAQKDVSYPYYFNLNDYWKGSFFDQQREAANEKGIKQLPDGSFIADFDDLPTHNDMDIEDSFNSMV